MLLLCASIPHAHTKAEHSRIPSHFPAGFAFALVAIAPPAVTKFSWDLFLVPRRALALIRAGVGGSGVFGFLIFAAGAAGGSEAV